MKKQTLLAASLATALASGGAFGVSLPTDGQGDLLFAPSWTVFTPNTTTELTVTNSDVVNSVVAKLIIRHENSSQELIDVMLYLSPGDRWNGRISCVDFVEGAGCVRGQLTSDDGSLLGATTVAISPLDPDFQKKTTYSYVPQAQRAWGGATGDGAYVFGDGVNSWNQGYAEVIMSRTSVQAQNNPDGIPLPVDHNAIYEEDWNAFLSDAIVEEDDTPNSLSGTATLDLDGELGRIQMEAIADYDNTTQLVVGRDTFLGEGAETDISELEAVLAKNEIVMPYNVGQETFMILTFPTKLDFRGCGTANVSPYFCDAAVGVGQAPFYLAVVRNMDEEIKFVNLLVPDCRFNNQSPPVLVCDEAPPSQVVNLTREMNVLPVKAGIANILNPEAPDEPAFFSNEGWVKIDVQPAGDLYNGGAPVIATYVTVDDDGANIDWNQAASRATDQ